MPQKEREHYGERELEEEEELSEYSEMESDYEPVYLEELYHTMLY
jgi:hypothetical protein